MKILNVWERIAETIRIIIGVSFILSGVLKAVNVYSFTQEIRLYIEVYMCDLLLPWAVEIALAICTIETTIGLLAMRNKYMLLVSLFFLVLMSFFLWLTGMNLFMPSFMGSIESCGCFGELIHFSALGSFIKSFILWGMAVTLFILSIKYRCKLFLRTFVKDFDLYVFILIGLILPLYSYLGFDKINHAYYLVGYVILCIMLLLVVIYRYAFKK